jgi:hypothetical protein
MRIWFALLAAPVLALADQSVAYATVDWACANQQLIVVHIVHVLFLVATIAGTLAALQLWHATRRVSTDGEAFARRHFLAGLATASGALSSLVIAAMWFPTWMLAPCIS